MYGVFSFLKRKRAIKKLAKLTTFIRRSINFSHSTFYIHEQDTPLIEPNGHFLLELNDYIILPREVFERILEIGNLDHAPGDNIAELSEDVLALHVGVIHKNDCL